MTASNRPEWLARSLDGIEPRPVPFPDEQEWPIKVREGEIRAARPMDGESGARLALITSLGDEGDGWVNTMLLTNLLENSTSKDVRLDAADAGLPFSVLVETDIVGPMFVGQLGPRLGAVNEDVLAALRTVKRGDDLDLMAGRRGLPVRTRKEHRAQWKETELQAMHDLAGECFSRLVLESVKENVLVDPGLLDEVDHGGDVVPLLRVVDLLKTEELEIELPEETLLADDERLRAPLSELGPDEWKAIEPLIQCVLTAAPTERVDTAVQWRPDRAASDSILRRRIAARAARGDRVVRLATKASFWKADDLEDAVFVAELEELGIVQVTPELMERTA